jgi:hypothetical protein
MNSPAFASIPERAPCRADVLRGLDLRDLDHRGIRFVESFRTAMGNFSPRM